MSGKPAKRRGFIAPGLTVTSASSASGVALYYGHIQPCVAVLLVSMGFALALAQTVVPQDSEDRVKLWRLVLDHVRFRFTHRSPASPSTQPPPPPSPVVTDVVSDARKEFGDALRACRVARKMTISAVANRLGCSESKVGRLERGVVCPKETDVRKLVRLYAMSARARRCLIELARAAQGSTITDLRPSQPPLRGVS